MRRGREPRRENYDLQCGAHRYIVLAIGCGWSDIHRILYCAAKCAR